MPNSLELPDCIYYENQPTLISPNSPTPNHVLYLSNLDDQHFLRFSIKYLYLFSKSVNPKTLKDSLARVLVHYYPLAGRVRPVNKITGHNQNHKLEIDCNGEGAVFAEGFMDITAQEFLEVSRRPNKSWRKLLYRIQAPTFLDLPPLVVQVTNLSCGAMILCTAINHCLCDGTGTSQFLHAWAHLATSDHHLSIQPFHSRHVLAPRNPPHVTHAHTEFTTTRDKTVPPFNINKYLQCQPLAPSSLTFTSSLILHLKKLCVPSLKCTTFEALASHTWRSWIRSLDLPLTMNVKLLFSVNVRERLIPKLPLGYYGNGFVLACAETTVKDLVNGNIHHGVKLIQEAKSKLTDDYIRSIVDLLDDGTVRTDITGSLVISQWAKLGLEDLDFGEGKPLYMGSVTTDIYCLFLPVAGDFDAVRVQVMMPESVVERFAYYMTESGDGENNGYADTCHAHGEQEKRLI